MNYLMRLAEQIREEVPANAMPSGDTSGLFLLYAILLLAKGELVTREDVHNAWVAWMLFQGEDHESMITYSELPRVKQEEDSPFMLAIHRVASKRGPKSHA